MNPDDKIIPIDTARGDATAPDSVNPRGSASITRRMSAPAIQLREMLQRNLSKQLQSMFDSVDDALFDLAENAPSNQQQNVFFESMREVRFKRVEIERDFLEAVQQGFVDLFSDGAAPAAQLGNGQASMQGSADSLAILDEDAVEEMVAIDSMVAKFDKQLAGPLAALDARLAHLAGHEVTRFGSVNISNPVCPKRLCQTFSSACRILSVDIKARIVLFKLFEKIVLSDLAAIYKQANEKLIRANVLPDYRGSVAAVGSATPAGESKPAAALKAGQQTELSERAISVVEAQQARELSQLISFVPQYGVGLADTQSAALSNALQLLQTSNYPVIGNEVLWQLLNTLQRQHAAGIASADMGQPAALLQRPEDVLLNLATKLAAASDSADHSIGQRERDVIGLVSMLFQFVLEDRVVSEPMKAALSRLQVPIIKVAMNESNFFCSPSHPARKLLNEMTESVVGWVASDNYQTDPLYQMVCSTVERITREYDSDSQLFFDVLADYKSWLDSDNKRTELRRKRLVDAESGRDESNRAREDVKRLIDAQPLEGMPAFISQMVEKVWSNILFLAYVQQGPDGDRWSSARQTLEKLIWTVSPKRSGGDRAAILRELPPLLKALRQGLESINYDTRAGNDFFEQLERAHMQVMQRTASLPVPSKPPSEPPAAGLQDVSAMQSASPAAVEEVSNVANNQYLSAATAMAVGQWVELQGEGEKKRCRLVAILRNSGKRIFINRAGSKAAELDVAGIAQLLESGDMLPLEDAQLFDKALTSIIDGLRKHQHEAVGT
ncbi:MAG: DUF1631 domain-containing protein [Gammaproteobacteria bacterium]|nr:DUF1631 domain-containing protein [Gammaproteobacteria bacterium]NND38074.1 DUF1631 domain-containing protein [Pseudomonadales bacterium]NNM11134.1 DUF1631 domain-containing protein [Pseudomonadales bacterium]